MLETSLIKLLVWMNNEIRLLLPDEGGEALAHAGLAMEWYERVEREYSYSNQQNLETLAR